MPAKMEKSLRVKALRKGLKGDRVNKYVYGTMRKTGWSPSPQKQGRVEALKRMNRGV